MEGETADFDCKVIGNFFPVTVINWKFDEKLLDVSYRKIFMKLSLKYSFYFKWIVQTITFELWEKNTI